MLPSRVSGSLCISSAACTCRELLIFQPRCSAALSLALRLPASMGVPHSYREPYCTLVLWQGQLAAHLLWTLPPSAQPPGPAQGCKLGQVPMCLGQQTKQPDCGSCQEGVVVCPDRGSNACLQLSGPTTAILSGSSSGGGSLPSFNSSVNCIIGGREPAACVIPWICI